MRNSNKTVQDVIEEILKTIDTSQDNLERGDDVRAQNCTMDAEGKASALYWLGIDHDFGAYTPKSGVLMCGYFEVEGVVLVKNGEIQWKAYADAVFDERHAWACREIKPVA